MQTILAATSRILSSETTGKAFVLSLLFVAAITAYRAIPIEGFVPRATASVIFLLNPFVYGRLHYGQLFLLAGYALLPWVALRLHRLLLERGVATALGLAVSLTVLGVFSPHLLLIASVLAGALVATHTIAASKRLAYLKRLAPGALLAAGVTALASAYWLIPLLKGSGLEGAALAGIGSGDLVAYAAVPDQQLGLLANLLGMYGFWAEDTSRFTSMKTFVPLWPEVLVLLLSICAVGTIAAFRRRRDQLAPWAGGLLAAAVLGLILEAGVSQPVTSSLVSWLDAHLTFYRGMRDAGKWGALLALVYSQLVALGAAAVLRWLRAGAHHNPRTELIGVVAAGLLLAFPLYYGNGLLYGMHGGIAPSQYPPGWYTADRVLAADSHPGRALFLPWHEYMALSFVRNQNHVVASPAPTFFSTPVLVSADPEVPGIPPPADPEQRTISSLVAAGIQGLWAQTLAADHIKYVLLAHEADWTQYAYLDGLPGLIKVEDYSTIVLYRNRLVA